MTFFRMKTCLIILAIVAFVALIEARPGRGSFRRGRGGPGSQRRAPMGPKGPAAALMKRVCRAVFADGTVRTKDCFTANGLFECQQIDLDEFPRIPRPLENVTEISLCLPVSLLLS